MSRVSASHPRQSCQSCLSVLTQNPATRLRLGRITTGVKIIDLEEGVTVASFTKVKEDETDPLYEEGEGENAAEEESRDNVTKETAEETPDDENG